MKSKETRKKPARVKARYQNLPAINCAEGITWDDVFSLHPPEHYVYEVLENRAKLLKLIEEGKIDYVAVAVKKCWERKKSCAVMAHEYGLDLAQLKAVYRIAKKAIVESIGFAGSTLASLSEQPDGTWQLSKDYQAIAVTETILLLRKLRDAEINP